MKTSVIPAGVTLTGEIEGRGELVVAGLVEGPIELEGALTIEEGGEVRGDVNVTTLVVRGVLAGTASATDSIRVEPSAIVVGDARAPRVNIVEGARFRGRVQMSGEGAPAMAPRRRRTREERRPEPREQPRTERRPEPPPAPEPEPERAEADAERPRKRRRGRRRPPPPNIPAVERQKARRKDGSPSSDAI